MRRFLSDWNDSFGQVEGLVRAALKHLWFITIHPFDDGNGPYRSRPD
jgi:Fic family protein